MDPFDFDNIKRPRFKSTNHNSEDIQISSDKNDNSPKLDDVLDSPSCSDSEEDCDHADDNLLPVNKTESLPKSNKRKLYTAKFNNSQSPPKKRRKVENKITVNAITRYCINTSETSDDNTDLINDDKISLI